MSYLTTHHTPPVLKFVPKYFSAYSGGLVSFIPWTLRDDVMLYESLYIPLGSAAAILTLVGVRAKSRVVLWIFPGFSRQLRHFRIEGGEDCAVCGAVGQAACRALDVADETSEYVDASVSAEDIGYLHTVAIRHGLE